MIQAMGLALIVAVPTVQEAQAVVEDRCVTAAQADAIIAPSVPTMISVAKLVCRRYLPPDAFLLRDLNELQSRLQVESATRAELGSRGTERLAGKTLSRDWLWTTRGFFGSVPLHRLLGGQDVARCTRFSELIRSNANKNAVELATSIRVASDEFGDDRKANSMPICKGDRP